VLFNFWVDLWLRPYIEPIMTTKVSRKNGYESVGSSVTGSEDVGPVTYCIYFRVL